MGNIKSTRWKNYIKKRTVDTCRRITAREARHIGAATVRTSIGDTVAQHLWCLCECGKRVKFLYQLEEGGMWKCRSCHNLAYKSSQTQGTYQAFYEYMEQLNKEQPDWRQEMFPEIVSRIMEEIHALWEKNVAPFDWDRATPERRKELLRIYVNEKVIKDAFEHRRWEWSGQMNEIDSRGGREIREKLWEIWKAKMRSANKTGQGPNEWRH